MTYSMLCFALGLFMGPPLAKFLRNLAFECGFPMRPPK